MAQMNPLTLSFIANVVLLSGLYLMWTEARRAARCAAAMHADIGNLCAERDRCTELFLRGRGVTLASSIVLDPKTPRVTFDPREVRSEGVMDPQARAVLRELIAATSKH